MNHIKLPRLRRYGLYLAGVGLWSSGAAWIVAHYWFMRQGEYGPQVSPAEPWALKVHGGFAMLALWFLGLLWGVHVVRGWQARRGRWSGGLLLGLFGLLVVTGYLLYYLADEEVQPWVALIHWSTGLATLPLFLLHRFVRKPAPARGPRRRGRAGAR